MYDCGIYMRWRPHELLLMASNGSPGDRKGGGLGKSVNPGGRRTIKKTTDINFI